MSFPEKPIGVAEAVELSLPQSEINADIEPGREITLTSPDGSMTFEGMIAFTPDCSGDLYIAAHITYPSKDGRSQGSMLGGRLPRPTINNGKLVINRWSKYPHKEPEGHCGIPEQDTPYLTITFESGTLELHQLKQKLSLRITPSIAWMRGAGRVALQEALRVTE